MSSKEREKPGLVEETSLSIRGGFDFDEETNMDDVFGFDEETEFDLPPEMIELSSEFSQMMEATRETNFSDSSNVAETIARVTQLAFGNKTEAFGDSIAEKHVTHSKVFGTYVNAEDPLAAIDVADVRKSVEEEIDRMVALDESRGEQVVGLTGAKDLDKAAYVKSVENVVSIIEEFKRSFAYVLDYHQMQTGEKLNGVRDAILRFSMVALTFRKSDEKLREMVEAFWIRRLETDKKLRHASDFSGFPYVMGMGEKYVDKMVGEEKEQKKYDQEAWAIKGIVDSWKNHEDEIRYKKETGTKKDRLRMLYWINTEGGKVPAVLEFDTTKEVDDIALAQVLEHLNTKRAYDSKLVVDAQKMAHLRSISFQVKPFNKKPEYYKMLANSCDVIVSGDDVKRERSGNEVLKHLHAPDSTMMTLNRAHFCVNLMFSDDILRNVSVFTRHKSADGKLASKVGHEIAGAVFASSHDERPVEIRKHSGDNRGLPHMTLIDVLEGKEMGYDQIGLILPMDVHELSMIRYHEYAELSDLVEEFNQRGLTYEYNGKIYPLKLSTGRLLGLSSLAEIRPDVATSHFLVDAPKGLQLALMGMISASNQPKFYEKLDKYVDEFLKNQGEVSEIDLSEFKGALHQSIVMAHQEVKHAFKNAAAPSVLAAIAGMVEDPVKIGARYIGKGTDQVAVGSMMNSLLNTSDEDANELLVDVNKKMPKDKKLAHFTQAFYAWYFGTALASGYDEGLGVVGDVEKFVKLDLNMKEDREFVASGLAKRFVHKTKVNDEEKPVGAFVEDLSALLELKAGGRQTFDRYLTKLGVFTDQYRLVKGKDLVVMRPTELAEMLETAEYVKELVYDRRATYGQLKDGIRAGFDMIFTGRDEELSQKAFDDLIVAADDRGDDASKLRKAAEAFVVSHDFAGGEVTAEEVVVRLKKVAHEVASDKAYMTMRDGAKQWSKVVSKRYIVAKALMEGLLAA